MGMSIVRAEQTSPVQLLDEVRQEAAMRETSKSNSQTPDDGLAVIRARLNAQQRLRRQNAGEDAEAAPLGGVTTSLENVGPNCYERIRASAGIAYQAQAALYGEAGYAEICTLSRSA